MTLTRSLLPAWFRIGLIAEFAAFAIVGGFGMFGLWAMLPYGAPQPSAEAVLFRYALLKLALPLTGLLFVMATGSEMYRRGLKSGGLLAFLPAVLLPTYFMWSLA